MTLHYLYSIIYNIDGILRVSLWVSGVVASCSALFLQKGGARSFDIFIITFFLDPVGSAVI